MAEALARRLLPPPSTASRGLPPPSTASHRPPPRVRAGHPAARAARHTDLPRPSTAFHRRCEPANRQIAQLERAAADAARNEAEAASDVFDWVQELNDRVPPNEYYERGLELQARANLPWPSMPFHALPPAFHRPSTGLPPAFHRPSTGLPLAFHWPSAGLPLASHWPPTGLPWAF